MTNTPAPSARRRAHRSGFSLIELVTVVAALVIVLGLMVNLANRTRGRAAQSLAERVLADLEVALARYERAHDRLPTVAPLVRSGVTVPAEKDLVHRALINNRQITRALLPTLVEADKPTIGPADQVPEATPGRDVLGGLTARLFDGSRLLDPWGTPIVYMPRGHQSVGPAETDRPFFVSAGPDGQFLTRDDNLYSYENLSGHDALSPLRTRE